MHLDDERELMIAAARAAGERIRAGYQRARHVENKGSIDLVTDTDRAAETIIVELIGKRFPSDTVLAEEGSGDALAGGRRWIIDPLDGTTNFAHGFARFAVSIALEVDGVVELGAVYAPLPDEMFTAQRGQGALLGSRRLQVSGCTELSQALLATGFGYDRRVNPDNNVAEFGAFVLRCQGMRRAGAAALDLADVAAGRLDGYWEQGLQAWDMAAGKLLIEEAGGMVRQYDGSPHTLAARSLVSCGAHLLPAMLELLQTARADLGLLPQHPGAKP